MLNPTQELRMWSVVRRALNHAHQDIKAANEATRYELASAHWDAAARTIAQMVIDDLNEQRPPEAE